MGSILKVALGEGGVPLSSDLNDFIHKVNICFPQN